MIHQHIRQESKKQLRLPLFCHCATHAHGASGGMPIGPLISLNRPRFLGSSDILEDGAMNKSNKYSPEVRERAARMVEEYCSEYSSLWVATESIALKIGCSAYILLE